MQPCSEANSASKQAGVTSKNSNFWNELCGTSLARAIGVTDSSRASLKKFDDWYFEFYPYLFDHIPFDELSGKKVLEIGLGYGTVSQYLVESGAIYSGLDVAPGPIDMVKHRLQQNSLEGKLQQGSILEPPFPPGTFECVVAIGCLHHTGNLQLAIRRCYELLRPGGSLIFMVYYAYSYRRILMSPIKTLAYYLRELGGYRGVVGHSAERERIAYDAAAGEAAPHTDWISARSLADTCREFSSCAIRVENLGQKIPFGLTSRARLLETGLPARVGLDIYATANQVDFDHECPVLIQLRANLYIDRIRTYFQFREILRA